GKDEVSRFADEEISVDPDPEFAEEFNLLDEAHRIDHHSIPDDTNLAFAQNARRNKVQDVFLLSDVDGVTGVVPALRAHDDIRIVREDIDDLAFAFIAPLGAYQDCIGHKLFAS